MICPACGYRGFTGLACPSCRCEDWNALQRDRDEHSQAGTKHSVDMTRADRQKAAASVWQGERIWRK